MGGNLSLLIPELSALYVFLFMLLKEKGKIVLNWASESFSHWPKVTQQLESNSRTWNSLFLIPLLSPHMLLPPSPQEVELQWFRDLVVHIDLWSSVGIWETWPVQKAWIETNSKAEVGGDGG